MRLDAGGLSEGESVDSPHAGETKFERAHIWASQTPNALDVIYDLQPAMKLHPLWCPRNVQKEDRRRSGSCAVVIVEHSTQTVAPMHRLRWRDDRGGPQKLVFEALMIAFSMVVRHELANRVLEGGLSEEDHSVQALGFY